MEFDLDLLRREVARVEAACASTRSPTVFSHCDLLSGNVMAPRGGARGGGTALRFIDFEYVDWAPRGFDWGNHFNEYAGFEGDYSRYPSADRAAAFLRAYLEADARRRADAEGLAAHECGTHASHGVRAARVDDDAVADAVAEANVYALASHMFWGAWSLIQARWSSIDFDYLDYARVRWKEYFARRDGVLEAAATRFGAGDEARACGAANDV